MAEQRCRQRRPVRAEAAAPKLEAPPMEAAAEPMNRYINASALTGYSVPRSCEDLCLAQQNRVLLEHLAELSANQNQLLIDLLSAVNALTAALLTTRAQV